MKENRRFFVASAWASSLALFAIAASAAEPSAPSGKLPLAEVILYSSGVGYFERNGEVDGRAEVDLRFKVDDINDLLKSLVVQDFNGGHISSVTYGSRDPLTKTLKSFGLDLTQNPTLGQLLNQVRGERVEILWPTKTVGTILGVEKKKQPVGENKEVEVEYLNVLTDEGLQSVPFAQVQKIKLLNERLNAELRQALEVLATGHDTQKKTVGITFDGQGKRKVSLAYITQTPVWKTSYRLVLNENAKPFLQGWAIVENTSDEDWDKVRLSLVSGRPISFVMDLYQPLYTTRPVVQPELYLSLQPQVYGEAIDKLSEAKGVVMQKEGERLRRSAQGVAGMTLGAAGFGGGVGGGGRSNLAAPAAAQDVQLRAESEAQPNVAYFGKNAELRERDLNLQQGIAAAAQAAQAGELFQYQITTPVTLARQNSALLPIINQDVDGEKLSIYNQNVQGKYPLNGFRLKNSTALHLMQGPLTVFDGGTYAGDARIEDLAPGQERLLSYGLDLKTEVEPQTGGGRNDLVTVKIRKGTLIATRKASEEKTYNVRNREQRKKTVLIEHPFRGDWELVEPKEKPERTRDVYRFPVDVDADKVAKLVVREEKQFDERVQLINANSDLIAYYVRAQKVSARVKDALQRAAQLRDRSSQTAAERARREQRTQEITQEQERIRENMAKLNSTSELYVRYVKKLDQQETELEKLRGEIESLKNTEAQQQRELNDYLLNLNVE